MSGVRSHSTIYLRGVRGFRWCAMSETRMASAMRSLRFAAFRAGARARRLGLAALAVSLAPVIIKSKTMSGFDAPYVPGWDCHGLPIELVVEKNHGKNIDPAKFREL